MMIADVVKIDVPHQQIGADITAFPADNDCDLNVEFVVEVALDLKQEPHHYISSRQENTNTPPVAAQPFCATTRYPPSALERLLVCIDLNTPTCLLGFFCSVVVLSALVALIAWLPHS